MNIRRCLFALTILMCLHKSHAQSSGIPGCPGKDATTQENCTVAQELLNAYNGVVQNDTSNKALGGANGSHVRCDQDHRAALSDLAKRFKLTVNRLKAKGDKTPERDAAAQLKPTYRRVQETYQNCMKAPEHLIETPGPKSN